MQVKTISYVHDPEAARKTFEILMELIQEELVKQVNIPIDEGKSELEDTDGKDSGLLS